MVRFEIQLSELSLSFQPLDCFPEILHSELSAFVYYQLLSFIVRCEIRGVHSPWVLNHWIILLSFFIQIFSLILFYFPLILFMVCHKIKSSELFLSLNPF